MKKKIQIVIGIIIGVLLLWSLFKDTDWQEVWQVIRSAHIAWMLMGLLLLLLSFFIRVWRWGYIVNPVVSVSFWRLFSATQIGFMANFILPARAGEVGLEGLGHHPGRPSLRAGHQQHEGWPRGRRPRAVAP